MRVSLLGIPVDLITQEEAVAFVAERVQARKRTFITTPNPEFVVDAQWDPAFRAILQKADLALPDGIGILWALRLLRLQHLSNLSHWTNWSNVRVAGTDLMLALCARAAREGWTVGLVGGGPGIADKTAQVLRIHFPGIKITNMSNWSNVSHVALLFIALGHKKQERWIMENQERLGATVTMGVGGAFDYIAGTVPRAPSWMRQAGFEWLFRLVVQPWRIRRQWKLAVFAVLVLRAFFFSK